LAKESIDASKIMGTKWARADARVSAGCLVRRGE
jgi:hypothetical protein